MRRTAVLSVLLCIVATASLTAQNARPQMSLRERQALLDSLHNPRTVAGGEVMRFERTSIDAGTMGEDDAPRSHTFRWRNEGDKPLVVTQVRTTCGCAKPTYDRGPVYPDGEAELTVTYYPKGHPGAFERRIFVYTQLGDKLPTAVLSLTGRVTASESPVADYPCRMGALLLKRDVVRMSGTVVQQERIACMNGGGEPLEVKVNKALLPDYIMVTVERTPVEAGGEFDIVVDFDPARVKATLPTQLPVVLEGLDLPPSRRTLTVRFGTEE